jgi:hypothetical protein
MEDFRVHNRCPFCFTYLIDKWRIDSARIYKELFQNQINKYQIFESAVQALAKGEKKKYIELMEEHRIIERKSKELLCEIDKVIEEHNIKMNRINRVNKNDMGDNGQKIRDIQSYFK